MKKELSFELNGQYTSLWVEPGRLLTDVLREDLQLTGTKVGCQVGECGACTVLVNGAAVNACLTPALSVMGQSVLTIEGVQNGDQLHPIQEAFMETAAVQCGFCIPGMVLSAKALLDANEAPSDEDIARGMSGNLCRCTGYQKIQDGVRLAADKLRAKRQDTASGEEGQL